MSHLCHISGFVLKPTTSPLSSPIKPSPDSPLSILPSIPTLSTPQVLAYRMGGNAFKRTLGEEAIPRMTPDIYNARKVVVLRKLKRLFEYVGIPTEAPAKPDHGDIDFVVYGPRINVTPFYIGQRIGAVHTIAHSMTETTHATSNYALRDNLAGDGKEPWFQVDVTMCPTLCQWNGIMFLHSLGDFGIILQEIAYVNGFRLGPTGLKVIPSRLNPSLMNLPPFHLSSTHQEILEFFDLGPDVPEVGTNGELFEWFMSSRFCNPYKLVKASRSIKMRKTIKKRVMYKTFIQTLQVAIENRQEFRIDGRGGPQLLHDCLQFFGKQQQFYYFRRRFQGN